jgi:transcriptional regulator with XRE-family HTH domain
MEKGTDMQKRFPQQDLADRLRAALESADVSQAELARACDVTEQSVHGWVTNGRIAKQHLPTIAALTGKSLDYFLVGLKTWRRAAALALPFLFLMPLGESIGRMVGCILCQIRKEAFYVRRITIVAPIF